MVKYTVGYSAAAVNEEQKNVYYVYYFGKHNNILPQYTSPAGHRPPVTMIGLGL